MNADFLAQELTGQSTETRIGQVEEPAGEENSEAESTLSQ